MKKKFLTMDDIDFKNKTVITRIDINSPYNEKTGKISDNERIKEHAKTIEELSDKGAKVIILAHQGRKGDEDFISLQQHSKLLTKHIKKKVKFVDDIIGKKAKEKIKLLRPRDIILLENVRFLEEETNELKPEDHSKSKLIKTLSSLANVFVNDAFSCSHRNHASVVGFAEVLPSVAGRVMEREIKSVESALNPKQMNIFVLGGAKPDDCLKVIEHIFKNKPESLKMVLTCGVLGELFLVAKGYNLGSKMNFLKDKGFTGLTPKTKILLKNYNKKIKTPIDVAVLDNKKRREISVEQLPTDLEIIDIGTKTAKNYVKIIKKADSVFMKGPCGIYEKKTGEISTKLILNAIAKSNASSFLGGGDTSVAIKKLKINKNRFSYISSGGGALIAFLSGEEMPGIEALKKSYQIFKHSFRCF